MPAGSGYTVTYDGVASTALTGFMCHEVERGLIGSRRYKQVEIGGMEGAHFFSEEPGLRALNIKASVLIDTVDPLARRLAVREVAQWYNKQTPRKLTISDEPLLYEMAIPESAPNVKEWRQHGSFELPFLCEPYTYESELQEHIEVASSATDTFVIQNDGNVWTPFQIQITASGASATQSVSANGRTWARATTLAAAGILTFNGKAGVIHTGIIYDTDLQGIFDPGTVTMATASGRPPFLEPGANNVQVAMVGSGYTVKIQWRNRFS